MRAGVTTRPVPSFSCSNDDALAPPLSLVSQPPIAAYAYLDGELHVKVSLAMDAIIRDLTKQRKVGPSVRPSVDST